MQSRQKLLSTIILAACGSLSTQTHAALSPNAILEFNPGVQFTTSSGTIIVKSGSYFGMDTNSNANIEPDEKTAIVQNNGIIIGTTQLATGSHTGAPNGTEAPDLDLPWNFVGNTGMHSTSSSVDILSDDGIGNVTLDFIGWVVAWNGFETIPINSTAWEAGFTDAVAKIVCETDCSSGETYILDYSSTVPIDCGCGFEGVKYHLRMEGTIFVPNTPPTASDVTISELPAASYTWLPLVSDPESPPQTLSCSIVNDGTSGAATVQPDCSSGGYTPVAGAGFTGTDSFTYKVNDGIVDSTTNATVNVNIAADPSPVCNIISATGITGTATNVPLDIANNCTDAGGTAIVPTSVSVTTPSTNGGTVSVDSATQIATYTPVFGFSGVDTFTYTVSDSNSTSIPAAVNVTVNASTPTSSDGSFSCGNTAIAAGSTNCVISVTDIGVTDNGSSAEQGIAQSCIGGCFDFEVTGFNGNAVQVVLPLSAVIPTVAAGNSLFYRKLKSTGWVTFDTTGADALDTAPGIGSGANAVCPPASSNASYTPGLTSGDRCIRLTIVDNGPNDSDAATGTIADPGGIGEGFNIDTRTSGSDGCSMSETSVAANQRADWWLVAGFMGLLGLFRLKRNSKKA